MKPLAVAGGRSCSEKLETWVDIPVGTLCLWLTRWISEMLILKKVFGSSLPYPGFCLSRNWECWASAAFQGLGAIENRIKGCLCVCWCSHTAGM